MHADRAALVNAREQIANLQAELTAAQLRESEVCGANHDLKQELGRGQIAAKQAKGELHAAGLRIQQLDRKSKDLEAERTI